MSCSEWKEYKLGDIIDDIIDNRGKTPPTVEEGIELIETACLIGNNKNIDFNKVSKYVSLETYKTWFRSGHPKVDDILISLVGANMGNLCIVKEERGAIAQNLVGIRLNKNICNPQFIYYVLSSYNTQQALKNMNRGSAQPNLKISDLVNLNIKLPSLEEQGKIANILSSLDDKIELNNEMNKTLEEMAQSIFKRWFVDFEFPNEDGEPYKSSGGEMVDSELGMIPNGWEVVNYINTSDIQYGFAFKSKLFNDKEGKPIIRIRDISNSYTPTYTTEEYNDLYIVTKNDILVGMDGEFKAHIWGGKDSLLNQRVLRIRPKDNNSIAYSYFSIKEPLRYLENSKVGTTVIHLGKKDIDNIKIVYPPNNLISKYRDIADNLINKICENKVEIMELLELRDSLLPKLMSGEIKVN